ncbi:MAG: hypothetical protein ACKV0T_09345 [Planctomycetales bacterium]
MTPTSKSWGLWLGAPLLGGLIIAAGYGLMRGRAPESQSVTEPTSAAVPDYRPEPVAVNLKNPLPGFRGEVHDLLAGEGGHELLVHWTPIDRAGRDHLDEHVPAEVFELFTGLRPVAPRRVFAQRDFSVLLPQVLPEVGEVWEIDTAGLAGFLELFHPHPSFHLVAFGRRAGPDGAFGLVRGKSEANLEIMFRVHAEFDLAQNVWLTPACFWGTLRIDRQAGVVEAFRMWVPSDNPLNMHMTVAESIPPGGEPTVFREIQTGDVVNSYRDIVPVARMELASAAAGEGPTPEWAEEIDETLAKRKLKQAFYAFEEIDWVPWDQAPARATAADKPILAVVLWGALDDQSC